MERSKNYEKYKKYRENHKEEVKERFKRYLKTHPEKAKEFRKRHYEKYKEQIRKKEREKYWENREHILEVRAEYRKKNKEKIYSDNRKRILKKYGLTAERYEKMLENQNDSCAICEKHFSEKIIMQRLPSIDHCHTTGKVRGLLCMDCNVKLSVLENTVFVKKANKYIKSASLSK